VLRAGTAGNRSRSGVIVKMRPAGRLKKNCNPAGDLSVFGLWNPE